MTSLLQSAANCPGCSARGRKVGRVTLDHLLRDDCGTRVTDQPYFVCSATGCDVVYFDARGAVFDVSSLRVQFGLKGGPTPRTVCYCFGYTVEDIEDQVARTGTCTVIEDIREKMARDGCRCEELNPLGACCLNAVKGVINQAMRAHGRSRTGALSVAGSVVAATMSSACCWVPLLLIAFGASAAGVSRLFEAWRVPMIVVAVLLLGFGFYAAYFRDTASGDACCARPRGRMRRLNRTMLWVAAGLVAAMILFPDYLAATRGPIASAALNADDTGAGVELLIAVEGMTCAGCAATLTRALADVPGVIVAKVDYETGRARVVAADGDGALRERIVDAVHKAGFDTRVDRISRAD